MPETKRPWIDVNEIKRAVSVEQVLARYGVLDKLQRRGNNLSGLSPFRAEKTPSFFVNLAKGVWNDMGGRPTFGGKEVPGNVVGLVMAFENCGFREALLKLHEIAGLAGEVPRIPATAAVAAAMHTRVEEVLSKEVPINEPFGKELRGLRYDVPFLEQRSLTPDRARYWGVGYCSRGLMKGRIVIPIKNRAGEVVAYIGRSLKEDDPEGKWRFPKGFHKSHELFGADRLVRDAETHEAVAKYGLIVVEGCFDVISLAEKGFKNTVSTLGHDVSPLQRSLLVDAELNPSKRVMIFFDNDEAGRAGRKKLASDLVFNAFVRYVDFSRVEVGDRTDPDQFTKDELAKLLG
jgi:DNA primase